MVRKIWRSQPTRREELGGHWEGWRLSKMSRKAQSISLGIHEVYHVY